jgi:hypothetical protein
MSAASPLATLRVVCADFLAAALEAAASLVADPLAAELASGLPDDDSMPLPAPPSAAVTVRLTEAATVADCGGVRVVDAIAVDILSASPSVPEGAAALVRVLTAGAPAREWATALWRAGVTRLDVRTAAPTDAFARCFAYLAHDEVTAVQDVDARAWALPLLPAENLAKPEDMLGRGGFQLELTFRAPRAAHASAADLPTPPTLAPVAAMLTQLVHASALLAPHADLQLEMGTYDAAAAPLADQHTSDPTADVAAAPGVEAVGIVPTLRHSVALSVRSASGTMFCAERVKSAVLAHLLRSAAQGSTNLVPLSQVVQSTASAAAGDASSSASAAAAAAAAAIIVAAGHAEHASGPADKQMVWSFTAIVARHGAAPELPPSGGAALGNSDDHVAAVYFFCQSALQAALTAGALDYFRAKTTAADWKTAFGLHLRGCSMTAEDDAEPADSAAAAECARLRFFAHDADSAPPPTLLVLYRRCKLHQPHLKLPPLGRKREMSLVKAAVTAALLDFKAATGFGTVFERGLRSHGLPAVAVSAMKIIAGGGPGLRQAANDLFHRWQEQQLHPSVQEDAGEMVQLDVESSVLAGLRSALDLDATGLGPTAVAADSNSAPPAAGADDDPAAAPWHDHLGALPHAALDSEGEDVLPLWPGQRGVRVRSADDADEAVTATGADDIFPAANPKLPRLDVSPNRVTQNEALGRLTAAADNGSDEDGWFL